MKIAQSLLLILVTLGATSCVYKDLSWTLRHSYSEKNMGVQNIAFQELLAMKKGESCSYSALYIFPLGNASIMEAAKNADIDKVLFIAESGFWSFPFSKSCTVVFGE